MTRRRLTWIIAVVLLLGVVAVTAVVVQRDSIGRKIVNAALRDTDYSVTDLSVESLSKDQVTLSEFTVQHADGLQIAIRGVTLPVDIRARRIQRLSFDYVRVIPAGPATEPVSYPDLLQLGLSAHELAPGIAIDIGVLELPWISDLADVAWQGTTDGQLLSFDVDAFAVTAATTTLNEGTEVSAEVSTSDGDAALVFSGLVSQRDGGAAIEGDAEVVLEHWLKTLQALGAIPAGVTGLSADVYGPVTVHVPAGTEGRVDLTAIAAARRPARVAYQLDEETEVGVVLSDIGELAAAFGYPSLDWRAALANADAALTYGEWGAMLVQLSDIECESGIRCELVVGHSRREVAIGEGSIGAMTMRAPLELRVEEEISVVSTSPADMRLSDLAMGGYSLRNLDLNGSLRATGDDYRARLAMRAGQGTTGDIEVSYDAGSRGGHLELRDLVTDFERVNASDIFTQWDHQWDVLVGRITGSVSAQWRFGDTDADYSLQADLHLVDLGGQFGDVAFNGLETITSTSVRSGHDPEVAPFKLAVAVFDAGFPVENISATLAPDLAREAVAVSGVSMETLGGRMTADPFRYSFAADANQLMVRPEGIQLQLIVDLVDSETLIAVGSISGEIPVTITEQGITTENGHVTSDPPGGAIRFPSGIPGIDGSDETSQVAIVSRALSNFEFETLTSSVTYTRDGDLLLKMRLQGINPDMDASQPIVLNLGLDNNVPQLLKSLQAARSISDILGNRFAN